MSADATKPAVTAEDEVVDLCRDLIRIDSSNTGETATSAGERDAAEYVAAKLGEAGLDVTVSESEPRRTSVVTRIPGVDSSKPPLLLHGHLDVVPAQAEDWSIPPFSGEITDDGYLWGRGAIDMKDMDAMILALVRDWHRTGYQPPRDIVVAYFADEEAGSVHGAHHLVNTQPELFEGVEEAISEVGGFSVDVGGDRRVYPIQGAEKGIGWMRLTATGRAGHGSFLHEDNAVTAISEAVARIGRHRFDVQITGTVAEFLRQVGEVIGVSVDLDDPELMIAKLGPIGRVVGATIRNTANPTMLSAGYKANVIPGTAQATVDGRFLPGTQEEFERTIDELAGPDVTREWISCQAALEHPFEGNLVEGMVSALKAEDTGAHPMPYMLSGGTDGKALARLGIRSYGFAPLRLPADLDFAALFHGVDERVPVDGLKFGVRVLDRLIRGL